jgi:hypothetical protein
MALKLQTSLDPLRHRLRRQKLALDTRQQVL